MKFKMKVCDIDDEKNVWWEEYDKDTNDANKEAQEIMESFNLSLHLTEKPRKLLAVVVLDKFSIKQHDWGKMNLVTVRNRLGSFYDELKCNRCGVTAKRYGFDNIIIDSKYKAKKYQRCDTSIKKLK